VRSKNEIQIEFLGLFLAIVIFASFTENKAINKDRFNHYRPANKLNQLGVDKSYFSEKTLNNFEKMFTKVNIRRF